MEFITTRRACPSTIALGVLLLGLSLGCQDPVAVSHSETVSITLSGMKPGDVDAGVVMEEKNINSDTGNPYGDFLKNATAALGGASPARIVLDAASAKLSADSDGILRLDQVFSELELFIASGNTTTPVGLATDLSTTAVTFAITEDLDWDALSAILVKGDFKIGIHAKVNPTTPKNWEARFELDLNFSAFE